VGSHCLTILTNQAPENTNFGDPLTVYLDQDCVNIDRLVCRHRNPGDHFKPLGSHGGKKLKDFLIDRKIPLKQRDALWVIEDDQSIIWVCGIEISDHVKISIQTKSVLELKWSTTNF